MGNSSTYLTDNQLVRAYKPEQWIKQNYTQNGQQWRNKFTHQIVQIYPLRQIPSIQDMRRYQLRSTHQYIVKVFNIAIDNHSAVCNSNQNGMLLVEHIPLKLNDLRSLDLQESLTVLHSAFRGFHTIQALFQLVDPDEQLIGFNEQGKTKVWLNRQFDLNYSTSQNKTSDLNQFERVIKVVRMVSSKIQSNEAFQSLKSELLENSINYFQASIVIEQFAFREQLSLKRYIRTDLLTRHTKGESHRRNTTISTFFPTDRSIVSPIRKSQIYISPHHLQNIKSPDRPTVIQANHFSKKQSFRQFQQPNSRQGVIRLSPALVGSRSIPKITFNLKNQINGIKPLQQKYTFSSPKAQNRVSFFSITSNIWSNPAKINQPEAVQPVVIESKQQNRQNKLQEQIKPEKLMVQDVKANSSCKYEEIIKNKQQISVNTPILNLQLSQKQRSIIDQCQNCLESSKLNSEQKQQPMQTLIVQDPLVQDFQASGMFRQIAFKQNKEQLPNYLQEIKQNYLQDRKKAQQGITLQLQSQKKQIPINFQSFAVEKVMCVENVSFAPKIALNNVEEVAGTTKSLDFQEKQQQQNASLANSELCESNQEVEAPPQKKNFRLVESQQQVQNKENQTVVAQQPSNNKPKGLNLIGKNRISLQLELQFSAIGRQEKPFYQDYTPVESKFDIIIKRDSAIDRDRQTSERSNKASAFAYAEEYGGYEGHINNPFKEMFPSEELRINRINSEYQTKTKRNNHDSSRSAKARQKLNKISNINQGQQDFLDINHLEKTLQMKCSKKDKIHKKSDEFDVAKLQQKLMKFSISRGQINKQTQTSKNQSIEAYIKSKNLTITGQPPNQRTTGNLQNLEGQLNFAKQTSKLQNQIVNYNLTSQRKQNDLVPSLQYQQSRSRYQTYNQQKYTYERNPNKYNSYSYEQNSKVSPYNYKPYNKDRFNSIYEKSNDLSGKIGSNQYKDRCMNILPQQSEIMKQTDSLFEKRYQKYVKQGKQVHTLTKQKSVDCFANIYNEPQQDVLFQKKRISYDNLRQFLLN